MQKAIIISIISIILVIVAVVATFYVIDNTDNKTTISEVENVFSNRTLQDIIIAKENANEETSESKEIVTKDNLVLQIDGESVLGVLDIEKIGFRGLVYEGTALTTLDKGVGHFESSPYFEGNVCFAGHNTTIWGELHTLENGDIITYISFMGEKKYAVNNMAEIEETDWSLLSNTEDNMITLITCVRNKPFKRLCVQAKEII